VNALLVFASAYGGFATLALAMQRYQAAVWRRPPTARRRTVLRGTGAFGLILSLLACVNELDWAIGVVAWMGTSTAASLTLALAITYRAPLVARSAAIAWVLSGAAAVLCL
jgi:hypothetical protein